MLMRVAVTGAGGGGSDCPAADIRTGPTGERRSAGREREGHPEQQHQQYQHEWQCGWHRGSRGGGEYGGGRVSGVD